MSEKDDDVEELTGADLAAYQRAYKNPGTFVSVKTEALRMMISDAVNSGLILKQDPVDGWDRVLVNDDMFILMRERVGG